MLHNFTLNFNEYIFNTFLMKKLKLISYVMIAASSMLFMQCTSDEIVGPAGADGINGVDGVDGTDGTDGTDGLGAGSCITCHSNEHREPIEASYALSGHAIQTIMYTGQTLAEYANFGGGAGCAECHSNEGYIDYITTGEIQVAPYSSPTAISCTACHDNHETFDFENDGYDYALRNFDPVPLRKVNEDYVIDYGDKSNVCITCHQPRTIPRLDADEDGLIEVPNRYGPHYGAQSIMLEGIYGAEIAGDIEYPAAVSSTHRNGASCVSCHMGEPNSADEDGLHSMSRTFTACTTCHSDGESLMNNLQTEITGLMNELEVLFEAEGLLDAEGNLVYDVDYPKDVADAYWNYKFVYYDHSNGVHNPTYARALLNNSIQALQN